MGNMLEFSLGLVAGGFISHLHEAEHGLEKFKEQGAEAGRSTVEFGSKLLEAVPQIALLIGSLTSLEGVTEGVMGAFERGEALEALHKRTGQSVADLYQLQKGFQSAGVNSDDLAGTIFQLQKSLGGVSENGEDTRSVFARMGLSVEQLKKQGAPEQINSILGALNKLGTSDAAKAASAIFGRMNAQSMIELSHSTKEFAEGMEEAQARAKTWERIAPLFEQVKISLMKVKDIGEGLFAGIAEGLAPAIKMGAAWLESFRNTLDALGAKVGNVFKEIAEAFKEGRIGELLGAAFDAAVERLGNLLFSSSLWGGVSDAVLGAFVTAEAGIMKIILNIGITLKTVLDKAFQEVFELIGKIPKVGKMLGLDNFTAQSFGQIYQQNQKDNKPANDWINTVAASGMYAVKSSAAEFSKAINESGKGPAQDKLNKMLDGLLKTFTKANPNPESASTTSGTNDNLMQQNHYKADYTQFEKMGFVMNGAGNPMLDYARRTALAVEKIAGKNAGGDGGVPAAAVTNAV